MILEVIYTNYKLQVTPIWNSLPNSVVMADSINSSKSRLDKFRSLHDFVYDYRAQHLTSGSKRN